MEVLKTKEEDGKFWANIGYPHRNGPWVGPFDDENQAIDSQKEIMGTKKLLWRMQ